VDDLKEIRWRMWIPCVFARWLRYRLLRCRFFKKGLTFHASGSKAVLGFFKTPIANVLVLNVCFLRCNTRNLVKNLPKLTDMLELCPKLPDVICITISENNHELISISGYRFLFNNSRTNAGGTGLYRKAELGFIERADLKLKRDFVEDIWIEICCTNFQLVLGTVYFHPNNSLLNFTEVFQPTLEKLTVRRLPYFILGDFNINLLSDGHGTQSSNFTWSIPVAVYLTRVVPNCTVTLLDHLYSNETQNSVTRCIKL